MDPFQILEERGVVDSEFVERANKVMKETGMSYESVLFELGLDEETVRNLLADYYEVPAFVIPKGFSIDENILDYIAVDSAKHYRIVPLKKEDNVLVVGSSDPDNLQMREALNFISAKYGTPYRLVYMLDKDIEQAIGFYANLKDDIDDALSSIESELDKELKSSLEEAGQSGEDEIQEHIKEDAPVTKIVATIVRYAVDGRASDIHIEPTDTRVNVRFRIDGILTKNLELPKNIHSAVVARVKILSAMRLDEKRRPQDGRFSATFNKTRIDFRVSILPTNHGEKIVMRILDTSKGVRSLEESGISSYQIKFLREIVEEPYGIILISGPTGSGKSTTLRGMIKEMDTDTKNVMSLEDPVEYNMEGVSQSQVRPEIGYTFANGLRTALRQDPDVIMVGEIRDKETAQLAIQAALTGHLVLSTIHTNNAIGVIPRLVDMGIDPYLIAPTLKMAIAQRLVKTLCDGEGEEKEIDHSMRLRIENSFKTLPDKYKSIIPESNTMLHPKPRPGCATGYSGRTAVVEVLRVNENMRELILNSASEDDLFNAAREDGFVTMQEDAFIKALNHEIPYEEIGFFISQTEKDDSYGDENYDEKTDYSSEKDEYDGAGKDDDKTSSQLNLEL